MLVVQSLLQTTKELGGCPRRQFLAYVRGSRCQFEGLRGFVDRAVIGGYEEVGLLEHLRG